MNREQFFSWLYHRFERHWASIDHFKALKEDYKIVLPEKENYDQIHRLTVLSYSDTFKPPSPAFFQEMLKDLRTSKAQSREFIPFKNGEAPPPEWFELKRKLGL